MRFTREIKHLIIGLLLIFATIGGVAAYWAITGPSNILPRDDNPRLFEYRARIMRGEIVDRNGKTLVTSVQDDFGFVYRQYHYESTYSTLGYYSLRYGEGGAEAAYNNILNGDDRDRGFNDLVNEDLLHFPRYGANIRLTLDLELQDKIYDLFKDYQGAVVLLSVPDGEVLTMMSLPTYNPNILDTEWEDYVETEGDPFFNRALQGNYQPGSLTHTILMTAALLNKAPLDIDYTNANQPTILQDVTLSCTFPTADNTLTLTDSYYYGCPSPFADFASQSNIEPIFDLFPLDTIITLPGFVPEPQTITESTPEVAIFDLEDVLGQGETTITPLQLAAITATFINKGNTPQPTILDATQLPNSDEWVVFQSIRPSIPVTTPQIALQMARLMKQNIVPEITQIGGQAALAYSGEGTHVWFTGFFQHEEKDDFVIALVIENTDDVELVRGLGIQMLNLAAAN